MTDLTAAALRLHDIIETTGLADLPRKCVASLLRAADAVLAAAQGHDDPVSGAYRRYAAAVVAFLVCDDREELEQLQQAGRALNLTVRIDNTLGDAVDTVG